MESLRKRGCLPRAFLMCLPLLGGRACERTGVFVEASAGMVLTSHDRPPVHPRVGPPAPSGLWSLSVAVGHERC